MGGGDISVDCSSVTRTLTLWKADCYIPSGNVGNREREGAVCKWRREHPHIQADMYTQQHTDTNTITQTFTHYKHTQTGIYV